MGLTILILSFNTFLINYVVAWIAYLSKYIIINIEKRKKKLFFALFYRRYSPLKIHLSISS